MYLKTWKRCGNFYASVVKSVRIKDKVCQETVLYIGVVEENQIPYLKAAYSKIKPKLVYPDGTVYEDKSSKS